MNYEVLHAGIMTIISQYAKIYNPPPNEIAQEVVLVACDLIDLMGDIFGDEYIQKCIDECIDMLMKKKGGIYDE